MVNERKPNRVINFIGNSLKLKIPLYASLNNILNEYLEEPAILSSLSYSTPICLKPTQVLIPLIYLLSSGILFKTSTILLLISEKSPESIGISISEIELR